MDEEILALQQMRKEVLEGKVLEVKIVNQAKERAFTSITVEAIHHVSYQSVTNRVECESISKSYYKMERKATSEPINLPPYILIPLMILYFIWKLC